VTIQIFSAILVPWERKISHVITARYHDVFLRCLLLNNEPVSFCPAAVSVFQILSVPFIRKITAENHEKMKQPTVVGVDRSSNSQRNESAWILDIVNRHSRKIMRFGIAQKENASERGNYQGTNNGSGSNQVDREGMERRSKPVGVRRDRESKMGKMICESLQNVQHEHDANHAEKAANCYF
jgi:hypothetical protein